MSICSQTKQLLINYYQKLFVPKFRVCVLGLTNSAKSSTISSVFNISNYDNTKEINKVDYKTDNVIFHIYDIKGGRKQRRFWDYFYKRCDVLVYCVDLSASEEVWEESKFELKQLIHRNRRNMKNMLVLGTKNDKGRAMEIGEMIMKLDLTSIFEVEIACFSISTKDNTNISLVEPWLFEQYKIKGTQSAFQLF
ncbi:ADP-ribosylation factor-like protein [Vairimorpha necatrix]|uniref:ADP-ribosylation factor-like protein n=1 Tax=Vairimorpha necatrix TaxID=6039 RepID=A0AAX4JC79_9MICR